jgi:CubicO group peptidase (beta-lactamase class C family)
MTSLVNRRRVLAGSGAAVLGAGLSSRLIAAPRLAPGGFAAERLAQIPPLLQSYVDDGSIAGAVTLLYRQGEIAQVAAVGYRDIAARAPMRHDTIFRLASMTKPITAAATLTLVDQGKIGLLDPIDRWLPELANPRVLDAADGALGRTHPAPRPITVADLLTHRSGVAGQFETGPLARATAGLRDGDPTFDVWLKRLAGLPLAYDPGTRFNYGTSHDVLGALISRVTGMSFEDYLRQAIFAPLGMTDTAFWVPQAKRGRLAEIYDRDPQTGRQVPASRPVPTAAPVFQSGSGALLSTVDDYLKFARMLLGKGRLGDTRILSRPTVAMMTTNWLSPAQLAQGFVGQADFWASQGFGLGVSVTTDVAKLDPARNVYSSVGSFGWPGSTGVYWRADPVEDLIAIYMIQTANPSAPAGPVGRQRQAPVIAFGSAAYAAIEI